jgi:hypothetical protein
MNHDQLVDVYRERITALEEENHELRARVRAYERNERTLAARAAELDARPVLVRVKAKAKAQILHMHEMMLQQRHTWEEQLRKA